MLDVYTCDIAYTGCDLHSDYETISQQLEKQR